MHSDFSLLPVSMLTKSCTKILDFSQDFRANILPSKISYGEMSCLGTVSTNLFKLFYAGEIQNLNCRRLEMATYFFLTLG